MTPEEFWQCIEDGDAWLDNYVGPLYQEQPLAQHWGRVSKIGEELGEVIAELISYTAQNPRKPTVEGAYDRMLMELCDVAGTALFALQHFTKDQLETRSRFETRIQHMLERVGLR